MTIRIQELETKTEILLPRWVNLQRNSSEKPKLQRALEISIDENQNSMGLSPSWSFGREREKECVTKRHKKMEEEGNNVL